MSWGDLFLRKRRGCASFLFIWFIMDGVTWLHTQFDEHMHIYIGGVLDGRGW